MCLLNALQHSGLLLYHAKTRTKELLHVGALLMLRNGRDSVSDRAEKSI